ncbi:MAG: hypothetical protein QOH46_1771 [Solirubrobacteraceae bacterium]|nr:hypothetical protein [Solirubrobacteraceae bacterium]
MSRSTRFAGALILAAALLPAAPAAGAIHTVSPGETLWGIATANNLPTRAVAAANGLSPDARVIAGSRLTIPARGLGSAGVAPAGAGPAVATGAPAAGGVRVQWGDTLSGLAASNGLSLSSLATFNGLDPARPLLAGTTLRMPGGSSAAPAGSGAPVASAPVSGPGPIGAYKVRLGDTLSALAARSRVPMAQMAFMNGLDPKKPLLAGTLLKLPTGAQVAASAPAPARTIIPPAPPAAAPGRLSASEIGSIAAEHGAPGSLATAIAWQESGFNNAMLSSANARGVMQILPGTWEWVQANLARSRLDPSSPADNVRAGSLYLAQLLRDTGGDARMAAAAYYQGLSSVRRIGMLPETQRYVDNVMALRARFGG